MENSAGREPLLAGRGLLPLMDFCRSAGLEPARVEALIRTGKIEGAVFSDGRVAGLFQDVLPTAERLNDLGLTASGGYTPDALRGSAVDDRDDSEVPVDAGAKWTMSWDDSTS